MIFGEIYMPKSGEFFDWYCHEPSWNIMLTTYCNRELLVISDIQLIFLLQGVGQHDCQWIGLRENLNRKP